MNTKKLWHQVLEEISISVSKPIYQTLLSQTTLISIEKGVATIACPNPYLQTLVENRYYSLIKNTLDGHTKQNNSLIFVIRSGKSDAAATKEVGPLFDWQTEGKTPNGKQNGFNPKYTFANLVVGNSNNFAHAAAQGIAQKPGATYNPFFIWGGVGVGKTHLVQALGQALLKKNPQLKILYCSSETFTNELVQSLQKKTITAFKKKFRELDALIIDDIQFIAGKEYSQEEFFHTFNTLHLAGKQIILTSDRRPEEIPQIEERLTSRFMGGLTVDIQPPDFEMRVAILKAKCQERGAEMEEQAILFLSQTINSNVRELEGTLFQILTQASVEQVKPDLTFVKKFFGVKNKTRTKIPSPKSVISAVAKHFKIKTTDLLGTSRRKEIVLPRQIVMYLLREENETPLVRIGEILGGKDHTTIIHGTRKIAQKFSSDSNLRHEIMLIKQSLSG